jgi:polyvinyl alcohol dehydrogenase (cytochrome)
MIRGILIGLSMTLLAAGADSAGQTVYKQRCAQCHQVPADSRIPAAYLLKSMSPENILRTLETGLMRDVGSRLTADERRAVAEELAGRSLGQKPTRPDVGRCADAKATFAVAGAGWDGWSADLANTRFQPAAAAGLAAADVPRLKLKWAFAFPDTFIANGQPSIVGGRIFVASANRNVYSLDARSGCQYWSFEAQAPVRTAISVATPSGSRRSIAFFGDQRANAYAVDATNGELLWKVHVDDHPRVKIVGAPAYYDGRLYVPVTAGEEGPATDAKYECCSARGALVALDVTNGQQIWKTYTIDEKPHIVSKNSAGTPMWGPSGASIWSAPTVDAEHGVIYAATGDNFSPPATRNSDAILAFDMKTGKILWSKQLTEDDVFNNACIGLSKISCPEKPGPDFDIASSPILAKLATGKRALLVGQKSGVAHALDPDNNGEILWQTRVGRGGVVGGIQFGSAFDGRNMYVAVSDMAFTTPTLEYGRMHQVDPKVGGGLYAIDAQNGKRVWATAPPPCDKRPNCSPAQSAAVTAIPGVAFSGSADGHLRAYSAIDGKIVWDFDTFREFDTVNGMKAHGGSMNGPGPTVANGMVYVDSGYGTGIEGNVLLAFSVER